MHVANLDLRVGGIPALPLTLRRYISVIDFVKHYVNLDDGYRDAFALATDEAHEPDTVARQR